MWKGGSDGSSLLKETSRLILNDSEGISLVVLAFSLPGALYPRVGYISVMLPVWFLGLWVPSE